MHRSLAFSLALAASAAVFAAPAFAAGADQSFDRGTHGVVEIETGDTAGIAGQIAADLAALLDDGATRRVVPVLGDGALQNIVDLKVLHGIDAAIVEADALDYARQQKLISGVETVTYIARLYNEEFHLLARADIKSVADLAGKKVDVGPQTGATPITAQKFFTSLGVAVTMTSDPTDVALAELAKGDIAAVALVAAKPAPLLRAVDPGHGLHFLSLPLKAPLTQSYAPTRLTAKDYPGLIGEDAPVDTVAVGTVLLAANLQQGTERYRNLVNFTEALFTQFPTLLAPGHNDKWHEVNLAADLPGWHRFPPAEQWLGRNAPVAQKGAPSDLKVVFQRFLDERLKAMGSDMTQQQKDELFDQFERWQTQTSSASH
ncbi:MAG TPA: TAXI family TRAP transporter solute-binding subunit [Stellaceae bacterium]|nr:TAXI family TRAP transporter solute-binding subunit [Stellaceae bacterium]